MGKTRTAESDDRLSENETNLSTVTEAEGLQAPVLKQDDLGDHLLLLRVP